MERNEAIAVVQRNYPHVTESGSQFETALRILIPELKESEGERIRKELIQYLKDYPNLPNGNYCRDDFFAWLEKQCESSDQIHYWTEEEIEPIISDFLRGAEHYGGMIARLRCLKPKSLEKQGEQKPADKIQLGKKYKCIASPRYSTFMIGEIYKPEDKFLCSLMNFCYDCFEPIEDDEQKSVDKIEPKYHKGAWVILTAGELSTTLQIVNVDTNKKLYWFNDSSFLPIVDEDCLHLWTIKDAKPGDVLVSEFGKPFIFKDCSDTKHPNAPVAYCGINYANNFIISVGRWWASGKVYPATKEQRETLLKAMADDGYTFDFEKKVLKKIENEIEIPFGAKDSELHEVTYFIPKGFHAEIDDDKVVIKKGEKSTSWSVEDALRLEEVICMTEANGRWVRSDDAVKSVLDWLKSLKDRYTWKPSEEQMKALNYVVNLMASSESPKENDYYYNVFKDLRKQLKKLMEE